MKCKVCQRPMVQLFMSWACDHCDGKTQEVQEVDDYARVSHWLALHTPEGNEISGPGYQRVKVKLNWGMGWAETTFPTATGNWGTIYYASLMDAEHVGSLVGRIRLNIPQSIHCGDRVTITWCP